MTHGTQAVANKARTITRVSKPADEMAPVVRAIAFEEFVKRPNTDRIARQFGTSRADIQDAAMFEQACEIDRIKRHLGIRENHGRRPARMAVPLRMAA